MKKLTQLALGVMALAISAGALAKEPTTEQKTGTVTIEGRVYDRTCVVDTKSKDQTVVLEEVSTVELDKNPNSLLKPKNFTLKFVECNPKLAAFPNFENSKNLDSQGLLENTEPAGSNVKVALSKPGEINSANAFDLNAPDEQEVLAKPAGQNGEVEFEYQAAYAGQHGATAGLVKTVATYQIDYK